MNRLWVVAAVVGANLAVAVVIGLGWVFPALVAAIGAVAAIVIFQRPQRGLLLLAAGLPFDGLRVPLHLPAWTSNWIEGMVVLTLVAAIVARPGVARPQTGRAAPAWTAGLVGLAVLTVASIRLVDAYHVVVGVKVMFQAVTMAFVAWRCPLSRKERDWLVTTLMVTGAVCAAWGLVQQGMGDGVLHDQGYKYNSTIRFSGSFMRSFSTFLQPFPFAFFLMIVLLIGIPIALNDSGRLRNRIFLILLPLYGLGMLVAIVRGAWIGTAVGLLWLGIRRYRILLLGIPIALAVLLIGPGTSGSNATSSRSGQTRVQNWVDNLYEIGDHPFGIGTGQAGAAAGTISVRQGNGRGYQFDGVGSSTGLAYQPDNQYFLFALELGLAGLWCYILFLVSAFRTSVRASERTGGDDSALALGTGAVILGYAIGGTSFTILEILSVYYFWLLIGVTTALAPDRKRGRVPAVAMRPPPVRHPEPRGSPTPVAPDPA
jgi:hypothetical protein